MTLAGEGRQYKIPGARYKQDAILPRENLNPWESVYDVIFTIRAHMGKAAVLKDLERWVDDNSELFPKIDTSAITQNWQDPRPILSDLAVLRLVRLQGYPGARDWTREHRPHKKCIKPLKRDYERYFVEGTEGQPSVVRTSTRIRERRPPSTEHNCLALSHMQKGSLLLDSIRSTGLRRRAKSAGEFSAGCTRT